MLSLSAFGGLTQAVQAFGSDTIELTISTTAPMVAEVEPFDHEPDLLATLIPSTQPILHPPLCARSLVLNVFRPARPTPPPNIA
jgi:hypothetical protein